MIRTIELAPDIFLSELRDRLFAAIKHGDEEHQIWLKNKLEEFFEMEKQKCR